MLGKKAGLFMALTAVMLLLGGCGNAGANLGRTVDGNGYDNGYGSGMYSGGGTAYWDGYGINSGRSMNGTGYNGGNYTTYGTRNDNTGNTLGQDLENTWDDLTGQNNTNAKANDKTNNTNNTNKVVD